MALHQIIGIPFDKYSLYVPFDKLRANGKGGTGKSTPVRAEPRRSMNGFRAIARIIWNLYRDPA